MAKRIQPRSGGRTGYPCQLLQTGEQIIFPIVLGYNLLAAGERHIAIVLSGHTVLDLKPRGAPIDQVILDPYFAQANKLMIARMRRTLTRRRCLSIGLCPKKVNP